MAASMQDLIALGLNPFAVQLLAESLLKSQLAARSTTQPVRFAFPVRRADCAEWAGLYITLQAVRAGQPDPGPLATVDDWRPMLTAPLDGTKVELFIRHRTWWTAHKVDPSKAEIWQGPCVGQWLDFNGGGWSWEGHMGTPLGWRPLRTPAEAAHG